MKKKNLLLALCALTLASCNVKNSNTSSNNSQTSEVSNTAETTTDTSTKKEFKLTKSLNSKVYLGPTDDLKFDETKYKSLPTSFFDNNDDVPYVSLNDFLSFFNGYLFEGKTIYSTSENTMTNELTKATMSFDSDKNIISCEDLDLFLSLFNNAVIHDDSLGTEYNTNSKLNTEKSYRIAGKTISWDMNHYNMTVVTYQGNIYLPYSIYQTLFLSRFNLGFAFTGNDFYRNNMSYTYNTDDGSLTDYAKVLYSTPMASLKTRTEGYSKYFYGSFLFAMENFNGKLKSMGITDLDAALENTGYKAKLLSSDSVVADDAIGEAMTSFFCDGGHTSYCGSGITATPSASREYEQKYNLLYNDKRYQTKNDVGMFLKSMRGNNRKTVEYEGETAIITFDSFELDANPLTNQYNIPNKNNVEENSSTFALVYNAFEEIKQNSNIKNVVFDVTLNGGGAVLSLGDVLGFLTNDDITFTSYNPVTGAKNVEVASYDTDLDGDFTDNDSYEGKYNFFILTSPYSYSCGNSFPCIASDYGYAKIVGQRSGGGDCTLGYGYSVDGTAWTMSSSNVMTNKDFSGIDKGAKLDKTIPYEYIYNWTYLDTIIKTIK